MTTANSAVIPPAVPVPTQPACLTPQQLDRSLRRASWRKELAECRPAAIAGATIYVGLPLPLISHRVGEWMATYQSFRFREGYWESMWLDHREDCSGTRSWHMFLLTIRIICAAVLLALLHRALGRVLLKRPVWRRPSPTGVLIALFLVVLPRFAHPLGVAAGLGLLALLASFEPIAVAACRGRHAVRLGSRGLTGAIAGVLTVIFVLGMREVGANMPVTATFWYRPGDDPESVAKYQSGVGLAVDVPTFACARNRIALSSASGLRLFELGRDRQVHELAQRLQNWEPPAFTSLFHPVPVFDDRGQLYTVITVPSEAATGVQSQFGWVSTQVRPVALLRPVDWDRREYGPCVELDAPPEMPRRAVWFLTDAEIVGGRLGVVFTYYRHPPDMPSNVFPAPVEAAYDFAPPFAPKLIWSQAVRMNALEIPGVLRTHLRYAHVAAPQRAEGLDPLPRQLERGSNPPSTHVNLALDDATYATADVSGLRLVRRFRPPDPAQTPRPVARVISSVPASPWAWRFRSPKLLLSPRPGLVWEIHESSAIAYDVSNPY